MMKQSLRILSVAASIAVLPALAMAGGGKDHAGNAQCRAAREAKLLPVYDTNRDGVLDQAERQAMREDMRKQALARFDADRDGRLNEAEWQKFRQAKIAEKFASLDTNHDGAISREEASAPCSRLAGRFDAVDKDGDGRITMAELSAVRMFDKRGKFRFRHDDQPEQPDPESVP